MVVVAKIKVSTMEIGNDAERYMQHLFIFFGEFDDKLQAVGFSELVPCYLAPMTSSPNVVFGAVSLNPNL